MNCFSCCQHFGVCGGCTEQTLSYTQELEIKQKGIEALFGATSEPIKGSDFPWQYRNKMEYSFSQSKKGEFFLGLMMRRGRGKVVTLEECHLTPLWFIETLKATKKWWHQSKLEAFFPPQNRGTLRTLTLREGVRTGQKMALLTVADESEPHGFVEALLENCPFDSIILRRQITAKKTPTRFEETVLYGKDHIQEKLWHEEEKRWLTFKIRSSSFFQPNTLMAEKIYNTALRLAGLKKQDVVFDLYCGIGTIGIFASFLAASVLGIEINEMATFDAKENAALNQVSTMEVLSGDVGKNLPTHFRPDVVFVDPPRVGLDALTLEKLLLLAPKKIIYISCNPKSQLENVHFLVQKGYRIEAIVPLDQFPHTPHVENVVALVNAF